MRFVVVIAFGVCVAAVYGQSHGGAIPITKHSRLVNADKSVNSDALHGHVASIKAKIRRGFDNLERNGGSARHLVEERGAGDPMTDYQNVWYGSIDVGTPPVSLTVQFDTGSSDLFVPSTLCDLSCAGHTLWNPDASSSVQHLDYPFEIQFADGSVAWGEQYLEVVSLVGFTASGQTIGGVTTYSTGFQIEQFAADGLMGMAFQSISYYNANPVFQTLVSEGQVPDATFSFKLSPASSGSELYVGGTNSALYTGDFSYAPVTHQGYWEVNMDSLQVNGQTILSNIDCIIDTGAALIIGSTSQVSALYGAIGGTPAPSFGQGYYTFPCNAFPNVSLSFGGTLFPIPASTLNIGSDSPGSYDCVSGIVGQDMGSSWSVGDIFLEGVYTVFDVGNARVGFAQLA